MTSSNGSSRWRRRTSSDEPTGPADLFWAIVMVVMMLVSIVLVVSGVVLWARWLF